MREYFLKRLWFIPITLIGVTLIVFAITRLVPGGPLEHALQEARFASINSSHTSRSVSPTNAAALSDEQLAQLKAYYGLDKPWYLAYLQWLGQVCRGDLGRSLRYGDSVWAMIAQRIPISAFYGIITLILTYGLCIPIGVGKALGHKGLWDRLSSGVLLVGYSLPSYVIGSLLVVFLAARAGWFPTGGFVGADFDSLGVWEKCVDLLWHSVLPLICYLLGSLTFLSYLIKNTTLDTFSADYMRTAVAKGARPARTLISHALRNSLIPLAPNFGQNLTLLISGSFFIETIFDIDGFGLLGYTSTLDRDYPVVMGVLLVGAVLLIVGNVISDMLVAWVDPRVRFEKENGK
jgi:microcin C transport system permease protein